MKNYRFLLLILLATVTVGCVNGGEKTYVKYVDWTIELPGNHSIVCYDICEKRLLFTSINYKGQEIRIYNAGYEKQEERQPLFNDYVVAYCCSDTVIGVCLAEDYSDSKLWKSTNRKFVLIRLENGEMTEYDQQIDIESELIDHYAFDDVEWIFTNVRPIGT